MKPQVRSEVAAPEARGVRNTVGITLGRTLGTTRPVHARGERLRGRVHQEVFRRVRPGYLPRLAREATVALDPLVGDVPAPAHAVTLNARRRRGDPGGPASAEAVPPTRPGLLTSARRSRRSAQPLAGCPVAGSRMSLR